VCCCSVPPSWAACRQTRQTSGPANIRQRWPNSNTTRWNLASKFGKYIAINMRCTFEFSPLIFHPQSLYSSRCRRSRQTLEGRNSRRRNSIKTRWNLTLKLGGLSKFICDRMYSIFPIGFSIGFGPTKPVFELGSSNPADFEARH